MCLLILVHCYVCMQAISDLGFSFRRYIDTDTCIYTNILTYFSTVITLGQTFDLFSILQFTVSWYSLPSTSSKNNNERKSNTLKKYTYTYIYIRRHTDINIETHSHIFTKHNDKKRKKKKCRSRLYSLLSSGLLDIARSFHRPLSADMRTKSNHDAKKSSMSALVTGNVDRWRHGSVFTITHLHITLHYNNHVDGK